MRTESLDSYSLNGGAQVGPVDDQIDFFVINGTICLKTYQLNSKGKADYKRQVPMPGQSKSLST